MRIKVALAALAATAAFALPAAAQTAPKVQVGVLRCNVAPYVGLVLGSVREMTCDFLQGSTNTVVASYKGTARRLGVDLGVGPNVLLGGSKSTIALQPVSVQGSTGLNVAAGISDLTLTPVAPAKGKSKAKVTK